MFQYGVGTANRLLAFLDSNNDLYITPVLRLSPVRTSPVVVVLPACRSLCGLCSGEAAVDDGLVLLE